MAAFVEKDPRNPVLRCGIEELASLISFKEFQSKEITGYSSSEFPLLSLDVDGIRPLRRLLSVHRFPYIGVEFTVGGSIDHNCPNICNLIAHRSAVLRITVPGETPRTHATVLIINADRVAQAYRPNEYLDESVKVDRLCNEWRDDLTGRKDVRSEQVVRDLNSVVRRLREQFLTQERERADAALTPTQKALVEAIRERGMTIHKYSNNRGFYDHFALMGYVGSRGKLEKIDAVFSLAADGGEERRKSAWRDANVFGGLELASLGRTTRFSVSPVVNEDGSSYYYEAVGRIGVAQRRRRYIPVELHEVNREGMMDEQQVSDFPSQSFRRFLFERPGVFEFENRAPILLATSLLP